MNVLGLNLSHDTSVCLLTDNKMYAVEEERFTRIKHNTTEKNIPFYFPHHALRAVLDDAGLSPNDIDHIVASSMDTRHALGDCSTMYCAELDRKIELIGHHKAHVLSGFALSGFDEAVALCIDGAGSMIGLDLGRRERVSGWYVNSKGLCRRLYDTTDAVSIENGTLRKQKNSLGNFYVNFAQRLIPPGDEAEGSMMALAAYADPDLAEQYYPHISKLVSLLPQGRFQINGPYGTRDQDSSYSLAGLLFDPVAAAQPFPVRAAMAAAVQRVFEETVCHIVEHLYQISHCRNLIFVGGCALNSCLNGKIRELSAFDNIFVPPAPNDAGVAVGCAYYARGDRVVMRQCSDSAYGPPIQPPDSRETEELREQCALYYPQDQAEMDRMVAKLLHQGQIVIYAQGNMEFGPRALGHRSIIASPCSKEIAGRVNRIKQRAQFRPLAPSVLHHRFHDFFSGDADPYMNKVATVKDSGLLADISHADQTARVQLVYEDCPFFSLITEFERLSSVPVILNTSCNRKGIPIDCTCGDVLRTFRELDVDACAVGGVLLVKKRITLNRSETGIRVCVGGKEYLIGIRRFSEHEKGRVEDVLHFLERLYRDRKRDQGTPFITHPLSVAAIIAEAGYPLNAEDLCVALLHDALWMGRQAADEIRERFSETLLERIRPFTKPHLLEEREKRPGDTELFAQAIGRMDEAAFVIKAADILANVRELGVTSPEKKGRYLENLKDHYIPLIEERLRQKDFPALSTIYTQIIEDAEL